VCHLRVAKHERDEQREQSALRKQWCRKALATAMRDMERPEKGRCEGRRQSSQLRVGEEEDASGHDTVGRG
jgi:hypothetical protein